MKTLPVLIVCLMLTGCAAKYNAEEAGPPPADAKAIVKQYIKDSFFDPYSLRDVSITSAIPGTLAFQSGYLLCLECNGKNRMGGYIGKNRQAILIRHDKVIATHENSQFCYTYNFDFRPWPEMEGK
jgi:hypothetical protein